MKAEKHTLRNYITVFIMFALTTCAIFTALSGSNAKIASAKALTVVIDAGHGGIDPGVVGLSGQKESDLNLRVAVYLKDCFESAGINVIMTRETETGLYDPDTKETEKKSQDMRRRGEIIKQSEADLMISIHMNSVSDKRCYGSQVFFQKGSKSTLAEYIQESIVKYVDKENKRVALAGDYFVLKAGPMPSVIVECGFLSNANDEKKLMQESYQKEMAWAIYNGVMKYWADGYPLPSQSPDANQQGN